TAPTGSPSPSARADPRPPAGVHHAGRPPTARPDEPAGGRRAPPRPGALRTAHTADRSAVRTIRTTRTHHHPKSRAWPPGPRVTADVRSDTAPAIPSPTGERVSFLPTGNRLVRTTATVLLTGALVATTGMAAQAREVGDPFGHLASATAVDGGVQVRGWAWDPSRSDATSVRLEIGSSTTTLVADEKRSDVADVHPSAGTNRGFEATVQAPAGTHEVCATAVNEGWGSDKALGCTTVTVAGSGSDDQSAGQGGKPGAHNTGVPAGTDLTVHEGDLTITEDGTVVEGLDVRGF